ncbi:MAG: hypothetical protein ACRDHX_00575 [Chloroflexota bacterium]
MSATLIGTLTTVGSFSVALAVFIWALFSRLEQRIDGVHTELKGDFTGLRTELKADVAELRTELKADVAEFRTELKADIAEVRRNLVLVQQGVSKLDGRVDELAGVVRATIASARG